MSKPTKTPQIPAIPQDVSISVRRWMESVKEVIEVREGTRGKDLDKGVTFRDLMDLQMDLTTIGVEGAKKPPTPRPDDDEEDGTDPVNVPPWTPPPGVIDPLPYIEVPEAPTHLRAIGGVGIIWVSWDNPNDIWRNIRYSEVYRAINSWTLSDADIIGTSESGRYIDYTNGNVTVPDPNQNAPRYYYWVRHVTTDGIAGPYSGPVWAQDVYNVLRDKILKSHLTEALQSEIYFITDEDIPEPLSREIDIVSQEKADAARSAAVEDVRIAGITQFNNEMAAFMRKVLGIDYVPTGYYVSFAARITTVETTAGHNKSAVQTVSASVDGIEALYTVKEELSGVDPNTGRRWHYIAGFGLISELKEGKPYSQFIVNATEFAIIDVNFEAGIQTPFMVGNVDVYDPYTGQTTTKKMVVIKDVAIGNATITSAKIVDLDASKIRSGEIQVDTKLYFGGSEDNNHHLFLIETFVDDTNAKNAHLVVYDNNGKPRVQLGRATGGIYGYNGFGIQVWDETGRPTFDANGARVKIDQAFINDLWVGGFKVTVPQSSFTSSAITVPTSSDIQSIYYDPQGASRLLVSFDIAYDFYGPWVETDDGDGAGNTDQWGITLYGPSYNHDYTANYELGAWVMFRGSESKYSYTDMDEGGETHIFIHGIPFSGTCSGSVLLASDRSKYIGKYRLVAWHYLPSGTSGPYYTTRRIWNRNLMCIGMR